MTLTYTTKPSAPEQALAKPQAYERILALGDERVLALNNLLARGTTALAVARVMQQQWGVFKDVKEETLAQQLRRYQAANVVVVPDGVKLDSRNAAPVFERLAVTSHMVEAIMIQRERIRDMVAAEKTAKKPNPALKAELDTYMGMLKDTQRQQWDMGIDEYNGTAAPSGTRVPSPGKSTAVVVTPDGGVAVMHSQVEAAASRALDTLDRFGVTVDGAVAVVDDAAPSH